MKYPKIYLALDNCFAIKRWVEPKSWMPLIKEIGFSYVEASFDNEIDFLFSPPSYRKEWFNQLDKMEQQTGVRVANFYTGYQTYRTAGLGHPNDAMADHLLEEWLGTAVKEIGQRKAGIGFSFHAITEEALQSPERYRETHWKVVARLQKLAQLAVESGCPCVCVEQMYAPHQPPWTITGTENFLRDCYKGASAPVYTTVDVGHMIGQVKFRQPTEKLIFEKLQKAKKTDILPDFWLGAASSYALWKKAVEKGNTTKEAALQIYRDTLGYPYLFSKEEEDSDPYAWLERLGCYSPIIHMQQTNGITASHAAFTPATNQTGIIKGREFLEALAKSYENKAEEGMPPKVEDIYLSFEIFASNTEYPVDIVNKLEQTAQYWHQFVPEDGLPLDELIKRLA